MLGASQHKINFNRGRDRGPRDLPAVDKDPDLDHGGFYEEDEVHVEYERVCDDMLNAFVEAFGSDGDFDSVVGRLKPVLGRLDSKYVDLLVDGYTDLQKMQSLLVREYFERTGFVEGIGIGGRDEREKGCPDKEHANARFLNLFQLIQRKARKMQLDFRNCAGYVGHSRKEIGRARSD